MKADKRALKGLTPEPAVHTIKVDLNRLAELGLYQIPEYEPDPVRVTKKLIRLLEEMPPAEGNNIKVDYARMEELGIYTRPPEGADVSGTFRERLIALLDLIKTKLRIMTDFTVVHRRPVMTAASLVFVVGLTVFVFTSGDSAPGDKEEALFTENVTVTYMAQNDIDEYLITRDAVQDETEDGAVDNDTLPVTMEVSVKDTGIMAADTEEVFDITEPISEEEIVEEERPPLVMANVETTLNVRTEPSEDADKVGVLYQNTGGTILEQEDGWTKIESGDLIGWAKDDYLLFDDEAQELADEVGTLVATVEAFSLNVRNGDSMDASVIGSAKEGDTLTVTDDSGKGWAEVEYKGETAYVSMDWVDIEFVLPAGETIEAIKEREAAAAEAQRQAEARAAAEEAASEVVIEASGEGITVTQAELNMMAAIIYCEAGGESYEGQVAVGAVVVNRVLNGDFPNDVESVIRASGQFSPVKSGKFDRVYSAGSWSDSCYQAAVEAANGAKVSVGNALYFKNPKKAGAHSGITIGNHVFW